MDHWIQRLQTPIGPVQNVHSQQEQPQQHGASNIDFSQYRGSTPSTPGVLQHDQAAPVWIQQAQHAQQQQALQQQQQQQQQTEAKGQASRGLGSRLAAWFGKGRGKQDTAADATSRPATTANNQDVEAGVDQGFSPPPSQPDAASPPPAPLQPAHSPQPALMPPQLSAALTLQPSISQPQVAHAPLPQQPASTLQLSAPGAPQQPLQPEDESPVADATTQEQLPLLEKLFYPLPEGPNDLDYQGSYQERPPDPQIDEALHLTFDESNRACKPFWAPTPPRETVLASQHAPKELLGLYKDKGTELGLSSLTKMEQRLAKTATVDRGALAQLVRERTRFSPSLDVDAAFERQRKQRQRQQDRDQDQDQQQLMIGALPPLAEEPEALTSTTPPLPGSVLPQHLRYNMHGQLLPPLPPQQPQQPTQQQQQQQQQQQGLGGQTVPLVLYPPPGAHGTAEARAQGPDMQRDAATPGYESLQGQGMQLVLADHGRRGVWFDEDGLMRCLPNPILPTKERPIRPPGANQDALSTYTRWPTLKDQDATENAQTYRLDIDLGRLEFAVHPDMEAEDMLAARLLSAFRSFKRREAVGLAAYYANKLAALEDALLASREHLFALSEAAIKAAERLHYDEFSADTLRLKEELREALAHTAGVESEVAEVRQLKEEEEIWLLNAAQAMQATYDEILKERATQGFWRTDIELKMEQRPSEEAQWAMGAGVPRDRLDAELLVVDNETIAGLPPPPEPFVLPRSMEELRSQGFKPRRLETMCASHIALATELKSRLDQMKAQSPVDPTDPQLLQLEAQLKALGPAPCRLAPRSAAERAHALTAAAQRVATGDVGVPRHPRLIPILTTPMHHTFGPMATSNAHFPSLVGPVRPTPKSNTHYMAKLHVNGHPVGNTCTVAMGDGFAAAFDDVFSVQVRRWPKDVAIHIFEKGMFTEKYIGTIRPAIPGMLGTPHMDRVHRFYMFSASEPEVLKTQASRHPVGSISTGPGGEPLVYPSGVLHVRCGWVSESAPAGVGMDAQAAHAPKQVVLYNNPLAVGEQYADIEAPQSLMPPVPHVPIDRMLKRAANRLGGKVNRQQVLRWLSEHTMSSDDPRNAALMELLKAHEAIMGGPGSELNLDMMPDVSIEVDKPQEKRTHFLARRWASGPYRDPERSVLKGARRIRIPSVLSAADAEEMEHIYNEALSLVELAPGGAGPAVARAMDARHDRAMQMQVGPNLTQAIEEREARIKDFGLRVRSAANKMAGGKLAARKYRTQDVVNEMPLPTFKLDVKSTVSILKPRRPLKREPKPIRPLVTSVPREAQLLVKLQRVSNLPSRAPNSQVVRHAANDLDVPDQSPASRVPALSPVQCFVEVRFRGISRRTAACDGRLPIFNDQMLLPVFDSEQEPSTSALSESREVVTINVFDEVIVGEPAAQPRVPHINREDEIVQPFRVPQRERRFLGCVHMPLNAIYQMQTLEGTLRLEVPPVLLGYTLLNERPPCVTLSLSLRPRLAPPPCEPEDALSSEADEITRHARIWQEDALRPAHCRTRIVRALAFEPDSTSLLVTRFVAPTPLPPNLYELAVRLNSSPAEEGIVSPTEFMMLKLARFVAMVPYLEDTALQKRDADVWTTSAQLLAIAGGDHEEHAHLLAGYFLEIGQQAFVVLGASCNGAKSCFVLTTGAPAPDPQNPQDTPKYDWPDVQLRIWNPLTGSVASAKDSTAELREVGMVYDHSNIWANMQADAQPWSMKWSLTNKALWKPFFGKQVEPRELGTVQSPPVYEELPDQVYAELEARAEEVVREALTRARSLGAFMTRPDNRLSRVLKQLLRELPEASEKISTASLANSLAYAQAQSEGQMIPGGPWEAGGSRQTDRHQAIAALQARHNAIVAHESGAEWASGHILALPFNDRYADALTEAVLNTGIHQVTDERARYSVAAFVEKGGAAFCCCLWVYIAVTR